MCRQLLTVVRPAPSWSEKERRIRNLKFKRTIFIFEILKERCKQANDQNGTLKREERYILFSFSFLFLIKKIQRPPHNFQKRKFKF